MVTTSIDQRVCMWRIEAGQPTGTNTSANSSSQSSGTMRVDQVYSHTHDVADVSSIALYHWG